MELGGNKFVCPRCGEVRLETPPGTSILPTLGMARKAAGAPADCDCGRRPPGGAGGHRPPTGDERPGAVAHDPGAAAGPGTTSDPSGA